jgi:hypothetical protein
MAKKVKLFQLANLVVGLKAFASSIVSMLIIGLIYVLRQFIAGAGLIVVAMLVGLFALVANFLIFGWLSRMWWKWK